MAAPMGASPESGRERLAAGDAPQVQRGPFLVIHGKHCAPPRANRIASPQFSHDSCPRRRGGLFFGRTERALDTCPKMAYLRDSLATGALKTMGKSRLALVAPTTDYGTVGRNPPPRRRNTELRAREYLTDAEINRLIVAASRNRHGHRDAT